MDCKTGVLGTNVSQCSDCGHIEYHNNSCRNRNCPNYWAVKKEIHKLNPFLYNNQHILYSLLRRCSSETLLELSASRKYLGATPEIIQVLHTWNQTLDYHVHMHCIVSGGRLTSDKKIQRLKGNYKRVLWFSFIENEHLLICRQLTDRTFVYGLAILSRFRLENKIAVAL